MNVEDRLDRLEFHNKLLATSNFCDMSKLDYHTIVNGWTEGMYDDLIKSISQVLVNRYGTDVGIELTNDSDIIPDLLKEINYYLTECPEIDRYTLYMLKVDGRFFI